MGMNTYLYSFLLVLRVAALIGLAISCIVTFAVLLDIFAKADFGYPWWAVLIALPTVFFFGAVSWIASKTLKAMKT